MLILEKKIMLSSYGVYNMKYVYSQSRSDLVAKVSDSQEPQSSRFDPIYGKFFKHIEIELFQCHITTKILGKIIDNTFLKNNALKKK